MKKIGFMTVLITASLLLTLAFSAAAAAPRTPAAPVAAAAPVAPAAVAPTPMPPHPRVHEAIEAMRNAREHMAHAEGEFHGHRAKAIEHLDMAIHEAEECEREP
jgi:Skp family chaperone for outer membrane proteins